MAARPIRALRRLQRRTFPVSAGLILSLLSGCAAGQESSGESTRGVSEQDRYLIGGLLQSFWSAAAAGERAAMQGLPSGSEPLAWVERWEMAYPRFFESTHGPLEIEDAYYTEFSVDTATIQLRVPWVSCPPPAHDGERDRYYAKVVSSGGNWRIVDIWKDIC